jgi:hypothetical protein
MRAARSARAFAPALMLLAVLALAGCGGDDNSAVFVLPSGTASASASAAASASASGAATAAPSAPTTGAQATPIPDGSKIIIDSPDASATISSPIGVSGAASVLNGTVVAVVLDSGGSELGRATTTASAASPDFGHYDVKVTFSGQTAGAKGQIKVFGVRADGHTPTYFYFIFVRFA